MIGSSAPTMAQQSYSPGLWDIVQGMLFDGQSPAEAAMSARMRNYQQQQQQLYIDTVRGAPQPQREAMLFNGAEFGKALAQRYAPQTLKGGETGFNIGDNSGPVTAPLLGFDPQSGKGYGVAGDATTMAPSPSLGGDFQNMGGAIASGRTGDVAHTVSSPQVAPMGSGVYNVTPDVSGGAAAAPVAGAAAPDAAAGAQAAAGAPRSVRNNNPGNVKALPGRQGWNGQVGVDPDGYAVFATPQDGARAADLNLQAYGAHHGINTVAGVVGRWSPDASQGAYTAHVAGGLGVRPDQPIDLSDAATRQAVLGRMYGFEAGRGVAPSAGGIPQRAAAAAGQPTPAIPQRGAPGVRTLVAPVARRILSPQEAASLGYAPGTVVEQAPDGSTSVSQAPQYDANWAKQQRELFANNEAYKQHQAASAALQALQANAGHLTGPSAYSILDTFARTINPGAVARAGTIQAIQESLGVPAEVAGKWLNVRGKGKLPLDIQQSILDAVTPFAQSHYDTAKQVYDANAALGAQHHFGPEEVTMPIGSRPERAMVTPGGALTPTQAKAQQAAIIANARQAIAQGKDRRAVIGRLQALGVPTQGF